MEQRSRKKPQHSGADVSSLREDDAKFLKFLRNANITFLVALCITVIFAVIGMIRVSASQSVSVMSVAVVCLLIVGACFASFRLGYLQHQLECLIKSDS
jgi:hypothetical protein